MGRNSRTRQEVPGCFNAMMWNVGEFDDSPALPRKSFSERKFSEGFEAPRNSLDMTSAGYGSARHEIPFGFEMRSTSEKPRSRSPSVIARLMGLETLPEEQTVLAKENSKAGTNNLGEWKQLMSDRREFLTSRSTRENPRHYQQGTLHRSKSSRNEEQEEFLVLDTLPFRNHPQERELQRLKQDLQKKELQRPDMLEAIQFLQSNKEFLVKFLQEPNSVFSKHVLDLVSTDTPKKANTSKTVQETIGFSRKLVEPRRESSTEMSRSSSPRKKEHDNKIVLLKSNGKKQSTPQSREANQKKTTLDSTVNARELARLIAKEVRENAIAQELGKSCGSSDTQVSEPSSRRYSRDFNTTNSLPNSPKLRSSKEGRKQLVEKLKVAAVENHQEKNQNKPRGKILKFFGKEPATSTVASDDSPRLLVRSRSVPALPEEKPKQSLDRTRSCKQPDASKGKLSSLKSSLLGKKKSEPRTPSPPKPSSRRKNRGPEQHTVLPGFQDDYIQSFHETEAQLANNYEQNNFAQSPTFLSVDIGEDTSSETHVEKSEQPSPVSVLERGFIESPSPVSFEDGGSDLQELQMRLERLKLDENGRISSENTASEASPQASIPSAPCCTADELYISKLLHASGFLTSSVGCLFNWHSPTCPIDPYLFGKLEEDYVHSEPELQPGGYVKRHHRKVKIGRGYTQLQRRPESLHRQLLFELVNETFTKRFGFLWEANPWFSSGTRIRPIPSGKYLLEQINKEISLYKHEHNDCEYPLENLVERDVNLGGDWMDIHGELQRISSQVEASIFNSLVEEVASSLIR